MNIIMKHYLVKWIQKHCFSIENSYVPKDKSKMQNFGTGTLYSNLRYGESYPNSFLDIYKCSKKDAKNPVILYVHGGGFTWGSKEDGDPNAGKRGGDKHWFFKRFMEAGYDIVSVEYAFAPEYQYPTPILQLQEAVAFLLDHEEQYQLDMTRIIFCGSSAGGHIAAQYAAVQTNAAYAGEMKIKQILERKQIRALLLNSALIDPTRYDVVHDPAFDFLLRKCGQAYFNEKVMAVSKGANQSNVLTHVTDNYPPVFISDANTGSFYDQAKDLSAKLKELGVRTELNLYPREEVKLTHGYESFDDRYGQDNMRKMLTFLKETEKQENVG